jgi:integrase
VEETRKLGRQLKGPKTRYGKRTITLADETVAVLSAYKVKQLELRLMLGLGKIEPSTLMFSTIEGGLLSPNNITRAWHRALKRAGLPRVSFHSLRHFHASQLINAGTDILTISRRLGHAKSSITLDVYGHLIEGADAAAAKAIEGVLK